VFPRLRIPLQTFHRFEFLFFSQPYTFKEAAEPVSRHSEERSDEESFFFCMFIEERSLAALWMTVFFCSL